MYRTPIPGGELFTGSCAADDLDGAVAAYEKYKNTVGGEDVRTFIAASLVAMDTEKATAFLTKHSICEDGMYPEIYSAYQQALQQKRPAGEIGTIQSDGRTAAEVPFKGRTLGGNNPTLTLG